MSTLVSLVHRAAAITQPYNAQDALLLIRALSALRLTRPEVKLICERASFSLASSPAEVPVAVLVDVVNHLCALQSAHFPVVRRVLVKRFREISWKKGGVHHSGDSPRTSSSTANPRTVQKAALVLAKLGRRAGVTETTDHVLRLIHVLLSENPNDTGLHIAYVALYVNSSRYTSQQRWWATPAPLKPSILTLQRSLVYLLKDRQLFTRVSGNVAWQLLHLLLVIPPSTQSVSPSQGCREGPFPEGKGFDICAVFGGLVDRVSAGAYAQFTYAFGADVCRLDLQRTIALLTPLARMNSETTEAVLHRRKPLNVYDQTKLASALAAMFSVLAIHPSRSTPFPVLGGSHGLRPGEQASWGIHHVPVDEREVWRRTVELCFTVLADLVWAEQERFRSTRANDASLIDATVPPDQFLVAVLLDSYARGSALLRKSAEVPGDVQITSPSTPLFSASCSALIELVPLLCGAPATMISWMLRSLVELQRHGENVDRAQLERSAAFLFRRYLSFSFKWRCLRSNVEMLYAYARMVGTNVDTLKSEGHRLTEPINTMPEKAIFHGLPGFEALDPVLREIASDLRSNTSVDTAESPMVDADMLLAAILHLYPNTVSSYVTADALSRGAREVPPLLDELQNALVEYYSNRPEKVSSEEQEAEVAMRAVRLHLLASHVHRSRFASSHSAAALAEAAARTTQEVMRSTMPVSSSSMLRALFLLGRGQRSDVATSSSTRTLNPELLCILCYRYQQFIEATVRASEGRGCVSEVVRVLWRARQVGVQLVFTAAENQGILTNDDKAFQDVDASQPQLHFPASLCCLHLLTPCAAADLLQLIAESRLINPQRVQLPPQTVCHLRRVLLEQLTTMLDVECVIRLVQSNATSAVSNVLFPKKEDLHCLLRCVVASIIHLRHSAQNRESDAVAKGCFCAASREQAGRLLHALVESQLFFRVPEIASGAEGGVLRGEMLQLAQCLEDSAQQADVIAVMKMRLLCGSVL